jgi:fructose-1-phosphate kinase PfkB-like protein
MNAAPHIFTLTGNLLAERTFTFSAWSGGRTQRATAESFQVGGKGINVAKMLARLGAPHTALCFTGGPSGDECFASLHASGRPFHNFPSATSTRSGTVVRAPGQPETTFLGPDAPPDALALFACAAFLDAQPDGQVLALCGSFPGWDSADFAPLRVTLERWLTRGLLVVDSYGPLLDWAVSRPVALIKINADELRPFAPDLVHLPAHTAALNWIVTDGPRTIQIRDHLGALSSATPLVVDEVSATGSGDVFLACLLHAWLHLGQNLTSAVRFSLPFAAANAAHPGIAEFPLPNASPDGNFPK